MVPKMQSARTPVAGLPTTPTTAVRNPLARIPPFGSPSAVAAPPRLPRGLPMVPACPIKLRHFVAGPTPNETNRTHFRYNTCVSSYDECQPLTKAKLTRSCAGPNPGAITYIQFTTDIALEETGRCKRLALEHHKWHRRWTSEARNVGSHPRPLAKRNGTRERAIACSGSGPGVRVIHSALTMPYATIERPCRDPMDLHFTLVVEGKCSGLRGPTDLSSSFPLEPESTYLCHSRVGLSLDSGLVGMTIESLAQLLSP